MRRTMVFLGVPIAAVTCICILCAASAMAEVPAAPPGFASEKEVKEAFLSGKLKPIDLTIDVPETVTHERNIAFGKGGDHPLQLDLYSPKDALASRPGDSVHSRRRLEWRLPANLSLLLHQICRARLCGRDG